jgi:outer membrane murein-binding lipoprotein Lpp
VLNDLAVRVASAIAPINVAGLADPSKRNWYGIDVEETAAAASKLGVDVDAVRRLFRIAN